MAVISDLLFSYVFFANKSGERFIFVTKQMVKNCMYSPKELGGGCCCSGIIRHNCLSLRLLDLPRILDSSAVLILFRREWQNEFSCVLMEAYR